MGGGHGALLKRAKLVIFCHDSMQNHLLHLSMHKWGLILFSELNKKKKMKNAFFSPQSKNGCKLCKLSKNP